MQATQFKNKYNTISSLFFLNVDRSLESLHCFAHVGPSQGAKLDPADEVGEAGLHSTAPCFSVEKTHKQWLLAQSPSKADIWGRVSYKIV